MSNNEIIVTDLQGQSVDSALVELFELELNDNTTLFFHAGLEEDLTTVKFHPYGNTSLNTEQDANEYVALPIEMEGISVESDGAANRPTVSIANVSNVFRAALAEETFAFEDLVGKKLTRRTTFAKYLVGGSAAGNPFEFPRDTYILDRVASETPMVVSFELAAPFDVAGIRLPNRVVVGKYCSWIYQGHLKSGIGGCSWALDSTVRVNGINYSAFFTIDNKPLIEFTLFDAVDTVWAAGTYAQNDFVTHVGSKWRSEVDSNSEEPGTGSFWLELFTWVDWSSITAYSIGDYVRDSSHIWKALRASTDSQPFDGSINWTRVDYCGKTLESCKARYQFKPVNSMPSASLNTNVVLPFGAYPGSVKFK